MQRKKICIVGAEGFGRETLLCLIDGIASTNLKIEEICCFMLLDKDIKKTNIMGVEVIPQSTFNPNLYEVVVAVADPNQRLRIVESLPNETVFTKIIHPTAIISDWVEIGEGSIITAGVILTHNIKIGKHAHLNLNTTIGHDCVIGDYFTTTPACNISGNCDFGNNVYLGTNSSVRQGISICNNVTIGMGGVVVKNIIDPGTYIGNPVKKLKK